MYSTSTASRETRASSYASNLVKIQSVIALLIQPCRTQRLTDIYCGTAAAVDAARDGG